MTNRIKYIDYAALVDAAMLDVIKKAISCVAFDDSDYTDSYCFYITFRTDNEKTELPEHIKKDYPKEMTIILQHQFKNLQIFDDYFSVDLSFYNKFEKITIPFNSIVSFTDSVTEFSLHFKYTDHISDIESSSQESLEETSNIQDNKVIMLDHFRKKK